MSIEDFDKILVQLADLQYGYPEIDGSCFHSSGEAFVNSLINDYRDSLQRLITRMEEVKRFRNFLFDSELEAKMSRVVGYVRDVKKKTHRSYHPFHRYRYSSDWEGVAEKFGIDPETCGMEMKELCAMFDEEERRQSFLSDRRKGARDRSGDSDSIRFKPLHKAYISNRLWSYKNAKRVGRCNPMQYFRLIHLMQDSIYRRFRTDRGMEAWSHYRDYLTKYSTSWDDLKLINEVFIHEGIIFIKCEDEAKKYDSQDVCYCDNELITNTPKGISKEKFKGWLALAPNFKGNSPFGTFFQPHYWTHPLSSDPTFRVVASREMKRLSMKSLHDFVAEVTSKKDKILKRDLIKEMDEVIELIRADFDPPQRDFDLMVTSIKSAIFNDPKRIKGFEQPHRIAEMLADEDNPSSYNIDDPVEEAALQKSLEVYTVLCDAIKPLLDT